MAYIIILLLCIIVNESLAELLSKSVFFGPLRSFLASKENKLFQFFSRVVECPYCCSVWTSMFLTSAIFLLSPVYLTGALVIDIFIFVFICHRVSNYLHDINQLYWQNDINILV